MPTTKKENKQRLEQLEQIREAIETLEKRINENQKKLKHVALLDSVSLGLYEEIDKLAKKAPGEPLTDIALSQVNDVIKETKELLNEDPYIQRLNQFVAAGDNPQHRDAVVVLRQIRQGLERSYDYFKSQTQLLKSRLSDGKGIEVALEINLEDGEEVSKKELKENGVPVSADWLIQNEHFEEVFSFTRLDRTNIREHFTEAR